MDTIAIFTTGGTIDKVCFDAKGGYEVGTPVVRQVLGHARADACIPVTELLRNDSLEMTAADRAANRFEDAAE
jgi:L-asparaginase